MKTSKEEIAEEIKELVIMRIEAMPPHLKISIGGTGTLTKEEMIEHVKSGDKEGKIIINMHMNFIKALTNGTLMRGVNSVS